MHLWNIGLVEDSKCTYCNVVDTLCHNFAECQLVKGFWESEKRCFLFVFHFVINFTPLDILLGIPNYDSSNVIMDLNFVILVNISSMIVRRMISQLTSTIFTKNLLCVSWKQEVVSCKGVAGAPEPTHHLFIKGVTTDTENDTVQKMIQVMALASEISDVYPIQRHVSSLSNCQYQHHNSRDFLVKTRDVCKTLTSRPF